MAYEQLSHHLSTPIEQRPPVSDEDRNWQAVEDYMEKRGCSYDDARRELGQELVEEDRYLYGKPDDTGTVEPALDNPKGGFDVASWRAQPPEQQAVNRRGVALARQVVAEQRARANRSER